MSNLVAIDLCPGCGESKEAEVATCYRCREVRMRLLNVLGMSATIEHLFKIVRHLAKEESVKVVLKKSGE